MQIIWSGEWKCEGCQKRELKWESRAWHFNYETQIFQGETAEHIALSTVYTKFTLNCSFYAKKIVKRAVLCGQRCEGHLKICVGKEVLCGQKFEGSLEKLKVKNFLHPALFCGKIMARL